MMKHLILALGFLSVGGMIACNKIEDVDRAVTINIMHPTDIDYHINLGVNRPQSLANWDTTGPINVTANGQVGDTIKYGINTDAPGCGLSITVDQEELVHLDLSGTAPNVGNGFLILE